MEAGGRKKTKKKKKGRQALHLHSHYHPTCLSLSSLRCLLYLSRLAAHPRAARRHCARLLSLRFAAPHSTYHCICAPPRCHLVPLRTRPAGHLPHADACAYGKTLMTALFTQRLRRRARVSTFRALFYLLPQARYTWRDRTLLSPYSCFPPLAAPSYISLPHNGLKSGKHSTLVLFACWACTPPFLLSCLQRALRYCTCCRCRAHMPLENGMEECLRGRAYLALYLLRYTWNATTTPISCSLPLPLSPSPHCTSPPPLPSAPPTYLSCPTSYRCCYLCRICRYALSIAVGRMSLARGLPG